jgi:hypothetical protein
MGVVVWHGDGNARDKEIAVQKEIEEFGIHDLRTQKRLFAQGRA